MNPLKGIGPGLANGVGPVGPLEKSKPNVPATKVDEFGKSEFSKALESNLGNANKTNETDLKISSHAQKRMESRNIDLSPQDFVKMQEAIQKARDKGSKESLILTDKAAFVVSVKNNTVITAVDRESLKENVFTNIDSTIMI